MYRSSNRDRGRVANVRANMIARCHDPRRWDYRNYGGRGIKVCDRWRASLSNFIDDMGHPPEGHQIDRINNDGNYEPSNCRWATRKEQGRNRRTSKMLTFNGKTQCLIGWAEETVIPKGALQSRIKRGWNLDRALTQPPSKSIRVEKVPHVGAKGEASPCAKLTAVAAAAIRAKYADGHGSIAKIAKEFGVCMETARKVIRRISWVE